MSWHVIVGITRSKVILKHRSWGMWPHWNLHGAKAYPPSKSFSCSSRRPAMGQVAKSKSHWVKTQQQELYIRTSFFASQKFRRHQIWIIDVIFPLVGWLIEGLETSLLETGNDNRWYSQPAHIFLPKGHCWFGSRPLFSARRWFGKLRWQLKPHSLNPKPKTALQWAQSVRIDQETDQLEIQEEAKTIVNADCHSFFGVCFFGPLLGSAMVGKCGIYWLGFFLFNIIYDWHRTGW